MGGGKKENRGTKDTTPVPPLSTSPSTLQAMYRSTKEGAKEPIPTVVSSSPTKQQASTDASPSSPLPSPTSPSTQATFQCAIVFTSHNHKDYLPKINEAITKFSGHTPIGRGETGGLLRAQLQYGLELDSDNEEVGGGKKDAKQSEEVVLKVGVISDVFYRDQIQRHNGLSLLAADLPFPSTADQLCSSQKSALLVQCVEHVVFGTCKVPLKSDVEEHEEALTLKRVFFEFVDCFAALFYVAFYRLDLPLLRTELCSLYMVDQIRRVVLESLIPFAANYRTKAVKHLTKKKSELMKRASDKMKKKKSTAGGGDDSLSPNASLTATESSATFGTSEASSSTFDSTGVHIPMSAPDEVMGEYESFDDYLETTMQFGYVTTFAAAFPLASVLSLMSNIIEVRSDLFKQVFVLRRPIPRRARSIGIWTSILRAFAFMSVISNTLLFAFTSDQMRHFFPFLYDIKTGEIESGDGRFVVSIAFSIEHILLAVVAILYWRIPSVPKNLLDSLTNLEAQPACLPFLRRKRNQET